MFGVPTLYVTPTVMFFLSKPVHEARQNEIDFSILPLFLDPVGSSVCYTPTRRTALIYEMEHYTYFY